MENRKGKAGREYYVYVYIDPRNFEEFYYGKGKGSRKKAHLSDEGDSEKVRRIKEIQKEGLQPLIKVIAANLTSAEAELIETTLIWKLGRFTTNIAAGPGSRKFRPHNTIHKNLSGFDFKSGIYYYNVGEGKKQRRNWEDYVKYGFIAAGHGPRWRDAMLGFNPGDIVAAYLKGKGYVGIGKILSHAEMAKDVRIRGKALLDCDLLSTGLSGHLNDPEKAEFICRVKWIKTVPRSEAKPAKKKDEIYTTTLVRASLDGQPKTIEYLNKEFGVDLRSLVV